MGRLILITNDDGIDAGGIRQLAETAKAFGEVWVVAPESQRSGKSHSVTYLEPLYVRERPGYMDGVKAYECSGVPVDCVRVGIHLLGRKPDVVLSGINSGYNISGDIQYSGTAGAALEAAFWGIHAIALSQANLDYHPVTDRYLRALIGEYMDKPLPQNTVWNINFPGCAPEDCKGVRSARAGAVHSARKPSESAENSFAAASGAGVSIGSAPTFCKSDCASSGSASISVSAPLFW